MQGTKQKHSGVQIIGEALDRDPTVRLALGCRGSVIGQWMSSLTRFYPIACQTITNEWVSMPYEILANGQAPDYQWEEIARY